MKLYSCLQIILLLSHLADTTLCSSPYSGASGAYPQPRGGNPHESYVSSSVATSSTPSSSSSRPSSSSHSTFSQGLSGSTSNTSPHPSSSSNSYPHPSYDDNECTESVNNDSSSTPRYYSNTSDPPSGTGRGRVPGAMLSSPQRLNPINTPRDEVINRNIGGPRGETNEDDTDGQRSSNYLFGTDLTQLDKDYIFEGLKNLYRKKILPLEIASKYSHFGSPPLGPSDFEAKPMVVIAGQYSVGKTSFIRSLLRRDFPGQRIGPEPTTDRFTAIVLSPLPSSLSPHLSIRQVYCYYAGI